MKPGYYWARWIFKDKTMGEWGIVKVEENKEEGDDVYMIGGEDALGTENFEFGKEIINGNPKH